jgi:hypothetical protein
MHPPLLCQWTLMMQILQMMTLTMSRNLNLSWMVHILVLQKILRAEISTSTVMSDTMLVYEVILTCIIMIAPKNDQLIQEILTQYHHDGITDRKKISHLLEAEHGVTMRQV